MEPIYKILESKSMMRTRWFDLIAKRVANDPEPHYAIVSRDYVFVVAVPINGGIALVRQFRPAIEQMTLELPCGHVEDDETPEQAARRELREETGFVANELIPLGTLSPDTGRLGNRMWTYFAPRVTADGNHRLAGEPGIEPSVYRKELRELLVAEPAFCSALCHTAILMAIARGYLHL